MSFFWVDDCFYTTSKQRYGRVIILRTYPNPSGQVLKLNTSSPYHQNKYISINRIKLFAIIKSGEVVRLLVNFQPVNLQPFYFKPPRVVKFFLMRNGVLSNKMRYHTKENVPIYCGGGRGAAPTYPTWGKIWNVHNWTKVAPVSSIYFHKAYVHMHVYTNLQI